MSQAIITPSILKGEVTIPPSKSDVHRAIICAALSFGKSTISPVVLSNDIKATIACINSLGAKTQLEDNVLTVDATDMFKNKKAVLDCGESGSTLRFFVPVAAMGGVETEFVGHGSLLPRPIGIFADILPPAGVECETTGVLPLKIKGKLQSGKFEIPGNISSQFITGLLFALPLLDGDSDIVLTSPIESIGYINMTIYTMSKFGVKVETTDYGWHIKGNQHYSPNDYTTDGDWSQAAFFMCSGAINAETTVKGVNINSTQGDKEIAEILKRFGADVQINENSVTVKPNELNGIEIDARQIPDLVPILAVTGAFAKGTTKIINAERLRIKESDRLASISNALNKLGAKVTEKPDGLVIEGVKSLNGGTVEGCNDHRIVMAMSIAAEKATDKVTVTDAFSINKSYPSFYEDYNKLGGNSNVINMG
ncbi:MAG: 3-phosphoshikimate 1-carboxyvinyltransferase [Ruminococcus sp.]|nr:3-phosphoshikimate 1-carboxyvinyltransferase [Ruminococcus sp.]